jgi:hypothetical protein
VDGVEQIPRNGLSRGGEREQCVDPLRHFLDAPVPVPEHALDPARIGETPAHHARDLLRNSAHARIAGAARIKMVERGLAAEHGRRRREAAREIGDPVAIEDVALPVVLGMDERVRRAHPVAKLAIRRCAAFGLPIGMR